MTQGARGVCGAGPRWCGSEREAGLRDARHSKGGIGLNCGELCRCYRHSPELFNPANYFGRRFNVFGANVVSSKVGPRSSAVS